MASAVQRAVATFVSRTSSHSYQTLPHSRAESESTLDSSLENSRRARATSPRRGVALSLTIFALFLFGYWITSYSGTDSHDPTSCDDVENGFQCQPDISHYWGQYSPYFTVPSAISAELPDKCRVTFAQILARHGARDPTATKTLRYRKMIRHLHRHTRSYKGKYGFLKDYRFRLGADQLTLFGEQQLVNAGKAFYDRYQTLGKDTVPFIRSSGQHRVVASAQNWTQGFHTARTADQSSNMPDGFPYNIVRISEGPGSNNTLSHGLCDNFETGRDSEFGNNAQETWASIFTTPITKRLNKDLDRLDFNQEQTIYLMDLCPFETVASTTGRISPFCKLFTPDEWRAYDYFQSLGKYYGFEWGNPLGATQGVGFANELIARLTHQAVKDHTSTNSTLDGSETTFPLGSETTLYADFSHDNDITGIFAALGLFNATKPLANDTMENVEETNGYSASWTVPFAARAYFEKIKCAGEDEEYIRVLVNDRVLPLQTCRGDNLGRCKLSKFVESLSYAQNGGDWDKCFT